MPLSGPHIRIPQICVILCGKRNFAAVIKGGKSNQKGLWKMELEAEMIEEEGGEKSEAGCDPAGFGDGRRGHTAWYSALEAGKGWEQPSLPPVEPAEGMWPS